MKYSEMSMGTDRGHTFVHYTFEMTVSGEPVFMRFSTV